jgi:hypothetical protein
MRGEKCSAPVDSDFQSPERAPTELSIANGRESALLVVGPAPKKRDEMR